MDGGDDVAVTTQPAADTPPRTRPSSGRPAPLAPYDLVVVGGGAAGLSAARSGARRGARTLLVERGRLGGECTFTGCVPSKALIEAAAERRSFADALVAMRAAVATIAATEDEAALAREGIEVLRSSARFVAPRTLAVGGQTVRARRLVLATGSAPALPPIPGLAESGYLTNESVFELERLPSSLVVLGGGPIGCELAQAFARFGAEVQLVESGDRVLSKEEPAASAVIAAALEADGVTLHLGRRAGAVRASGGGVAVELEDGSPLLADAVLVATGRTPRIAELDCAVGGVALDGRGYIRTDDRLRTTAPGVYAVGDVTGRLQFTHAGDEMGRIAVANALGRLRRRRFDASAVPWVTFCDPEVARVGPSEAEAVHRRARVALLPMTAVDRAVAAGRTEGFIQLLAAPRSLLGFAGGGRVLGATIVAPRAGELIHEVALAVRTGAFTGRLAQTVHAYPTWSTAIRQAAAQFFMEVDGRRARPATVTGAGDHRDGARAVRHGHGQGDDE